MLRWFIAGRLRTEEDHIRSRRMDSKTIREGVRRNDHAWLDTDAVCVNEFPDGLVRRLTAGLITDQTKDPNLTVPPLPVLGQQVGEHRHEQTVLSASPPDIDPPQPSMVRRQALVCRL